ncbi:Paired amphipathic helix protein Sin3-like [Actinidia chinensis var. chinensis]|uniref:Paired amphipathic helix protein Sin3-like n=1 Tax=Actinidia chinensis var. chinensis TaxID=1590841 RepID=A0A2R6QWX7_ACTCC|nr:Paired amphipathic helix protein Sin3-like [Actinidia chinensis var. chinensis]
MKNKRKFNPTWGLYDWHSAKQASVEFLNKVRQTFDDDDRTYKAFLDITTTIVENPSEIDGVYKEVSRLFKDEPGLSIEFSKFSSAGYQTVPRGTEEDGSDLMNKIGQKPFFRTKVVNPYEKVMFKCEDDQFEVDMILERLGQVERHSEELFDYYNKNRNEFKNSISIVDKYLTILDFRCIKKLYGDSGDDMVEVFRRDPIRVGKEIILPRVEQKIKEAVELRSEKAEIWRKVCSENHQKAADHRSFNMEQNPKKRKMETFKIWDKSSSEADEDIHEITQFRHINSGKSDASQLVMESSAEQRIV